MPPLRETLAGFGWTHEPARWSLDGALELTTQPDTDYWQRTHYGFRRDNGHFFRTEIAGDFSLTAALEFAPNALYDQCGLLCRADENTWAKCSVEYETAEFSHLGSVVTNLGYSDWATQEISTATAAIWYRLERHGDDIRFQWSPDGRAWRQLRIAHLHGCPERLQAGVYACSPTGPGFACRVSALAIGPNDWRPR